MQTWKLWLPVGSLEKEQRTQPLAAGQGEGCQGQELKSFRKVKLASGLSFQSLLQGPLSVSVQTHLGSDSWWVTLSFPQFP